MNEASIHDIRVSAVLGLLALVASSAAVADTLACESTVTARVAVIDQPIQLNRQGAVIPGGMIYALLGDVVDANDRRCTESGARCEPGEVHLRSDKRPRPMVLRVNQGDCLRIELTNLLTPERQCFDVANERVRCSSKNVVLSQPTTRAVSLHVQGFNWVDGGPPHGRDDGAYVGENCNSIVAPSGLTSANACPGVAGSTVTYTLYAERQGSFFLYDNGDNWTALQGTSVAAGGGGDGGHLTEGLFGAVNVQPPRSGHYRSQVTEQDLCLASTDCAKSGGVCAHPCRRERPDRLPVIDYQATYPPGYRDPLSGALIGGEPILDMVADGEIVHSDLTAIITGPLHPETGQPGRFDPVDAIAGLPADPTFRPVYANPARLEPYREFTIIYHESFQVGQAFPYYYQNIGSVVSASDAFGINYSMEGLSSPILANRLGVGPLKECVDCKYEEFFLSSWTASDPGMVVDAPATNCVNPHTGRKLELGEGPCERATQAFFPDDPSNVYHAYMSDHVKFRILHAGPDLHHLHHQHAHQWLATPNTPNGDYLDSQSIGPGSSFTLEMVYNGSGNVNQTVGDSIFHCHFYPHFASGMWGLWRVHDVFEAGTRLDAEGIPDADSRALPDAEIVAGTPIPALVPMPTLPMAPLPAPVRLAQGGKSVEVCTDDSFRNCVKSTQAGRVPPGLRNPGYPFFIPGVAGSRAPHPPMDFAWACRDGGDICVPCAESYCPPETYDRHAGDRRGSCPAGDVCEPLDGGLPRNIFLGNTLAVEEANVEPETFSLLSEAQSFLPLKDHPVYAAFANVDYSKTIQKAVAQQLPEGGTAVERVAMETHSVRFHPSQFPEGPVPGETPEFVLNGLPPVPGAPYADPCINFRRQGGRAQSLPRDLYSNGLTDRYLATDLQIDAIFNKEGWHFPQQRILTLWGDVFDTLDGTRPPEPLFFRVNSYDCMEYVLANLVPNVYELDDFQVRTPTDILGQHIHLVKFDVTSSDGAANGWNYEDGTFGPNEVTERIAALNKAYEECARGRVPPCKGGLLDPQGRPTGPLEAKFIKFFGPGPVPGDTSWEGSQATVQRWYDDPLLDNFGLCVDREGRVAIGPDGGGIPCTPVDTGSCPKSANLCNASAGICSNAGAPACLEGDLTRCAQVCTSGPTSTAPGGLDVSQCNDRDATCIPAHDRTIRTVFTHDHFSPSTHQQAGLYAGLVVEPKGSQWFNNQTGELMGGWDPATNTNFKGRHAAGRGDTHVFDGGPTSWEAIVQGPPLGVSKSLGPSLQDGWRTAHGLTGGGATYREFMLEFQDSALMYEPFNDRVLGSQVKVCSTNLAWICGRDSDCPVEDGRLGECRVASICRDDPRSFCYQDADCMKKDSNGELVATGPCDALGVCSNTGVCSNRPTGPPCLFPPPGASAQAQAILDRAFCGPDGGTCRLVIDGGLRSCTVKNYDHCASQRAFQDADGHWSKPFAGFESCDFVPGVPFTSWGAGSPLDAPGGIEVITFNNATNNFSVNYRNEPLQGRYTSSTGAGAKDLAYIYSSAVDRPGLPADPGRFNSAVCPAYNAQFAPCRFCSDNGEACTRTDLSKCADPSTAYCAPYRPLTPGVERGDPFTPLLRAYPGDDVQIRTLVGAHINPHNFTLNGMNWPVEPSSVLSGWRNSQVMGISEHFELLVKVPPVLDGTGADGGEKPWSDYLYQPGAAAIEQSSGNWGLLRAYHDRRQDLPELPINPAPFPRAGICPAGAPTRAYEVVALTAEQALPLSTLVYNERLHIQDPNAILFFDLADPNLEGCGPPNFEGCAYESTPTPLVLRAAAGDCIEVTLYNAIPGDICSQKTVPSFCNGAAFTPTPLGGPQVSSQVSLEVGLRPQLVSYDVRSSDGANIGFNGKQTVPPITNGTVSQRTYTWYAGHYDPEENEHIPIEFGAANLLPPDPLNHYLRGLIGGLVVEPPGATWTILDGDPTRALVSYSYDAGERSFEGSFREFVVFQQDNLPASLSGALKKPIDAVNYKSEFLRNNVQRYCTEAQCLAGNVTANTSSPTDVSCMLSRNAWCPNPEGGGCEPCADQGFPETPIFEACAGEAVRFRLLHPGGTNTNETFELFGHSFSEAPYSAVGERCFPSTQHVNLGASQYVTSENLCGYLEWLREPAFELDGATRSLNGWKGSRMGQGPTNHFDVVIGSAGGPGQVPGDYLYRSYSVDHFNLGMWGIFRVLPGDAPSCSSP